MIRAGLESVKRKKENRESNDQSIEINQSIEIDKSFEIDFHNFHNEAKDAETNPINSQLSAMLFSSSPPLTKAAKLDNDFNGIFGSEDETEFAELFKEIENVDVVKLPSAALPVSDSKNTWSVSDRKDTLSVSDNMNNTASVSFGTNATLSTSNNKNVNTLAYYTENHMNDDDEIYSSIDSIYNEKKGLLPMIDISTPQIFSQSNKEWEFDLKDTQTLKNSQYPEKSTQCTNTAKDQELKLLLPETFVIEDLRFNLKLINPIGEGFNLNPVEEVIKESVEKRISIPLALMLRDFRQIGSMAQLRLIDGSGNEIKGTIPISACTELNLKLHFGLIFVLNNVTTFSPVPGIKHLNITKGNISQFYYNARTV